MLHSHRSRGWFVGVALLLGGGSAQSHSIFGFQGEAFSGALHLLVSPLSLAALVAAIALLHGQPERRIVAVAALMALASIGGGVLAGKTAIPSWSAAACIAIAIAGVAAAAGIGRRADWIALPFALLAGLGAGLAIEFDAYSLKAVLGMAIAVGFLVGAALSAIGAFSRSSTSRRWVELGLRVLGSWAAAIALLLGALAWRVG